MNWTKLQNGSDIRGVALEGVEGENINLSTEVAQQLGVAFAVWVAKKQGRSTGLAVAVGMDSRLSGPALKDAFTKGLTQNGVKVYDCNLASTPAMFMATINNKIKVDAGVMLTASHLPFNRNGMKFFTEEGGLNKVDITSILTIAEQGESLATETVGEVETFDFISVYAEDMSNIIRQKANAEKPLAGLKIIVDAGNGAGGFFADKVLVPLGADVTGSQFLDPDGNFPNHVPNPEDPEAMQSICDAVVREKADLGIIFDTDVDRSAIVDRHGNPINRNELIAMISAVILEEHPGSTIVTDSITSDGLAWFIETKLKGKHQRFKRGYKNVINESIRLNETGEESWLAIETSGHAALKENSFLDDGAFLVAKLLIKMALMRQEGKELTELISDLPKPKESKEFRVKIDTEDFGAYGKEVIAQITKEAEATEGWTVVPNNFEGVRIGSTIENEEGWFLVRLSLHDPVIPVNIESNNEGGVSKTAQKLHTLLKSFDKLVLTSFE